MERWGKGRFKTTIKELSQSDNKSQRSLSRSLTILMWIIRIQLHLSKAATSWIYFVYKQLLDGHKACKFTLSLKRKIDWSYKHFIPQFAEIRYCSDSQNKHTGYTLSLSQK